MILATIKKDVVLLLRDRGALASMFVLPVVFIGVFGFMFKGSGDDDEKSPGTIAKKGTALAVHAAPEANGFAARALKDLEANADFAVTKAASIEELDRLVATKKAAAGVILPSDLDPDSGRPATIVIDDAQGEADRAIVEGPIVGSLVSSHYFQKYAPFLKGSDAEPGTARSERFVARRAPVGIKKRADYADSFQITVPSNAVLFAFFLCVGVGMSFVEERRLGTWRRLLAAPVRRPLLLLGKLVPFFVIGFLQMAFLFVLGHFVFGMHLGGSLAALALVTLGVVTSAVGLGFLVASFGGSEKQVGNITSIVVLVMGLLSGCMFPRAFMPKSLQGIGLALPHGWALDAYRDVLVREGAGVADILLPTAVLFGFGALFAALGSVFFRFER